MIGKLKGIIDTINEDSVIIDVGGVGYNAFCSGNTLRNLPKCGEAASLIIETHVREDHIHLYGFADENEKRAFLTLTKISGVGSKVALAILSVFTPQTLAKALAAQDKAAFTTVSGVGPKLATRIVSELKDKFSFATSDISISSGSGSVNIPSNNDIADAIAALVGLGYSRSDSYSAVNKIAAQNDNAQIDILIREGLKELGSK